MIRMSWVLAGLLLLAQTAGAQSQGAEGPPDLKSPPPGSVVVRAAHCAGGYFRLDYKDGKRRDFPEVNLRLKVDTSAKGPPPGVVVSLRSGMIGDRASLVFASVADLKALLHEGCGS